MYCKIIYKCKEDGNESNLTNNYLEENNLHFKDEEELSKHVDGVIKFQSSFGLEIEGIEIINIDSKDYFDFVFKKLNRLIFKIYSSKNNINLGATIKEQLEKMNDIDTKIEAYEYILDFLEECSTNPFINNNNVM